MKKIRNNKDQNRKSRANPSYRPGPLMAQDALFFLAGVKWVFVGLWGQVVIWGLYIGGVCIVGVTLLLCPSVDRFEIRP